MMSGQGCFGVSSTKNIGIVTPWQQFPMVIGATTTAPTKASPANVVVDIAVARRNGNDLEIIYNYRQSAITGAANGSGTYLFPIPFGLHMDTAVVPLNAGGTDSQIGWGNTTGAATSGEVTGVFGYNLTNLCLISITSSPTYVSSTHQNIAGLSTLSYSFRCSVPILEFRS